MLNIPQNTSHFIIRFTKIHYCWPCRKFLTPNMNDCGKLRYIKVQKCNFRTTQNLNLSPYVAMILRPALRVGAFLVGRRLKKWWTRKSDEEKKEYKQWFNERRNVFLGCFGLYGILLLLYYVTHLETDPLSRRTRFIIFNKEQEKQLGKMILQYHLELHKTNLVPRTHAVYQRLIQVIDKIVIANKDITLIKQTPWSLAVVTTPLINSYILPGGTIFISLDILKIIENDDQLAIILTHEMAHSLLSHSLELLSDQLLLDFLMMVPMLLIWAIFPYLAAPVIQFIGEQMVNIMYKLPYNRNLEYEADQIGLNLAAKACIDVREAVVFWAMMRTLTELHSFPTELRWISTHPAHGDREKNLNEKMPAALKLRHDSGCPRLPAIDPRDTFYKRSLKEKEMFFRERGILK
ncbi:hypothetical protein HN011_005494 [Eciton burchellii]|nr:hypothetical protein HN011_005494 [Eciton burchellii]